MATKSLVYVDLSKRLPASSVTGESYTLPVLQAGQTYAIALRFIDIVEGTYSQVFPRIVALEATLGNIDARPSGGTFSLVVNEAITAPLFYAVNEKNVENALSLAAGTGFIVDSDRGTFVIRKADNSVFSLTAGENNLYPRSFVRIEHFNRDGRNYAEMRLVQAPLAYTDAGAAVLPEPPYWRPVIDGYTSADGTYTVNEVQELVIPPMFKEGTYQLVYGDGAALPIRSELLDLEDGAPQIEAALNKMFATLAYPAKVSVTNPATGVARVEFGVGGINDGLRGVNVPLMQVFVPVSGTPQGDWTFSLNLDSEEIARALRDKDSITVPFELEIETWKNASQPQLGTDKIKCWSVPITIEKPQLWDGLATRRNIDWMQPPEPKTYLPFSTDQIVTGHRHYRTIIPAGVDTAVIDHNLDSPDTFVTLIGPYPSTYGKMTILDPAGTYGTDSTWNGTATATTVFPPYKISFYNDNRLEIQFGTGRIAPRGINDIPQWGWDREAIGAPVRAIVTSAIVDGGFQQHSHEITDVARLDDVLRDFGSRIAVLEKLLPQRGVASAESVASPAEFDVPSFGEILPDINYLPTEVDGSGSAPTLSSQLIVPNQGDRGSFGSGITAPAGTTLKEETDRKTEEEQKAAKDPDRLAANMLYRATIEGIGQPAQVGQAQVKDKDGNIIQPEVVAKSSVPVFWPPRTGPKYPMLFGAVLGDPQPIVGLPSQTGVYTNAGNDILFLPGGGGRKTQQVIPGGLFARDAYGTIYRVTGANGKYHPLEFERELWRVYIGSAQFPGTAKIYAVGEVRMRLAGEFFDDDARDADQVDIGAQYMLQLEAVRMDSDDLMGVPLETIVLGRTRIALTPAYETVRWELKIENSPDNTSKSTWTTYQKATATDKFRAPSLLRMKLCEFDVDNVNETRRKRGQVALVMPETKLEITI